MNYRHKKKNLTAISGKLFGDEIGYWVKHPKTSPETPDRFVPSFIVEDSADWEEVKEPTFQVGEWVKWSGSSPVVGQIYKQRLGGKDYILDVDGNLNTHDSCHFSNLRLATNEEILEELIKRSGFKKEDKIIMVDRELALYDNYGGFMDSYDGNAGDKIKDFSLSPNKELLIYTNGCRYKASAFKLLKEEKYTFGGKEIEFSKDGEIIECDKVQGTFEQIEAIIEQLTGKNVYSFGNVRLKSLSHPHGDFEWNPLFPSDTDLVTIGCTVGTYKEIKDIYEHAKKLRK